ncbi:hypothetical protein BUALT_Bualt03G0066800 [Buddleja alternifolia]|uniref:B box-type domain-containing protein n=1 Tax=Buddleja alternifolia TaxID=168488 RepID=A0AAV6XYD3_9LAMI|nr:hypothetical protein BUALT_Bualt03G0066800 [Buddleja alternifolia]
MKKCELCNSAARMYCDSDQASLCWDCDSRVHAANFLVAKHTRTLLCHACQSPTPWTGSGPRLGPTVSVCDACVNRNDRNIDGDRDHLGDGDTEDEDEDDEDEDEEGPNDDHHDDDDDENQVVPLSLPPSLASSTSSSSSEDQSSSRTTVEDARFSYNGMERPEEKKGTQKTRSWTWR